MLARCSEDEQRRLLAWLRERHPIHALEREFGTTAEVILEAIARGSDLSRRGVLGLIAEASFQMNVADKIAGWSSEKVDGDQPFDFRFRRGDAVVSVQVKRQRLLQKKPMIYRGSSELLVVETQRTRTGTDKGTGAKTRPYRFGDFDVLAVCMQPSTGDWSVFRYTVQRWLLPQPNDRACLQVLQPVSLSPNADWSDNLPEALERHVAGGERRVWEPSKPTKKRK